MQIQYTRPILPRLLLYVSILLWIYAFWTSINCLTPAFEDLRNRVTGARLMKDGIDPYLFIWKSGLPVRYYDCFLPQNLPFSLATATPAFHWLLSPLAELSQYQINVAWFALEWGSVLAIVFFARKLVTTELNKNLISFTAALLCLTSGFKQHIFQGQLYLFVPALMMVAIWLIEKQKSLVAYFIGGLCLTLVFFIRPTFLLLLAPLILYKQSRPFVLASFLSVVAYVSFVCFSPTQKQSWNSYIKSIQFYSGSPVSIGEKTAAENPMPFKISEGLHFDIHINDLAYATSYVGQDEISNYYLIHKKLTGQLPSTLLLTILQGICIVVGAIAILWFKKKQPSFGLLEALCLAAISMWCFDFCTFVGKALYNVVLLFYPIMLLFCRQNRLKPLALTLLFIGILMNFKQVSFITMPETVGQMMMLLSIFIQCAEWPYLKFRSKTKIDFCY